MSNTPLKKILVVDDEPDVRDIVKSFLEISGYTVMSAACAEEALQVLELERPKVVLLDVVMPDMDGIECLKTIKKMFPDTIVIVISGLQDEGLAKEAIRYGAYDYLVKPFDFDYLRKNVLGRIF